MSLKIGPHSNNPPTGNEDCGIVRTIGKKNTNIQLCLQPFASAQSIRTPWYDTGTDGTTAITVSAFSATGCTIGIVQSEDPSASLSTYLAQTINGGNVTQAVNDVFTFQGVVTARYWRVVITNVGNAGNVISAFASIGNYGVIVTGEINAGSPNVKGLVGVAPLSGTASIDGATPEGLTAYNGNNPNQPLSVASFLYTGNPTTGSNANGQRTPAIFTGAQSAGGSAFSVWNPPTTKKIHVMRYALDIAEDATITSGPLPINIGFRFGLCNSLAAQFNGSRITMFDYTHRVVLPAAVLATGFDGYVSPWVDLGNGVTCGVAAQQLYCGLQAVQGTGPVTPTWTLATTGQWEAGCAAFTTTGGKGAFKLRQYATATGAASATLTLAGARGTAVFVLVRTTNIAGGVPTTTVTDSGTNSWTKLTAINNTSDTGPTNGSSLQLIYCLNMVGTDAQLGANTVTATTSVNAATKTDIIVAEYTSLVAADASAQTTGTGNSTAPAAGAFSPTSSGDLVLTYAATGTAQATCPTLGTTGFFAYAENGLTNVPCTMLGDNFGNGTLAAGVVNVVVCGTEE